MATNLKWSILPPQSELTLQFTPDSFYFNPVKYSDWLVHNIESIPRYDVMIPNDMQVHMKNIVNAINTFMKTHEKQLNTLDIDLGKHPIMIISISYVTLEGHYRISISIYPEKYIDFDSNFIIRRNNVANTPNPDLYSGIYCQWNYSEAGSSYSAIQFYVPIKQEYITEDIDVQDPTIIDTPYVNADITYDFNYSESDGVYNVEINYGNYRIVDSSFSRVHNYYIDNSFRIYTNKGYSLNDIYSFSLTNLCNASDIDFDGTTHENDIKRPSRKNISSTPNLPTYYSLSGISGYNLYQIPVDQLDECVSYLNSGVVVSTSSGFLTWIKLLARIVQYAFLDWINNRNDYIISWKMAYYTPTVNLDLDPTINVGATSGIQIANHHITQQYDTIDCGNISIEATSFTDYEPYTYYEIYLPFVGTVPLRADSVAGRTLNVKYVVDNVSGESTCIISTIDGDVEQIMHTYECNLSIDIPYKAFDYLGNIRRNASALVNSVVGAAAGGALMSKSNAYARSALASTSKKVRKDYLAKSASYGDMAESIPESSSEAGYEQPQCIRSNVGSSLLSSMLPRKPYLIIRRVPMYNVNDSNRVYGRPTLEYATLDTYNGFMVKVRQVRLDGLTCTDDEKNIIQSILESGVIINE